MLFVAQSELNRLHTLMAEADLYKILSNRDMRYFSRLGALVSLLLTNNRITLELNLFDAKKPNSSSISHLLSLAHDIIN